MFKFRRLLCAVLVCALVGVAYAGATKIRSFTTWNEPEDADGMAILNVADSQGLVIQIIVSGFTPDTTYLAAVSDGVDSDYFLDVFTTDGHGNGRLHYNLSTLFPWPNVRLYHCVGDNNPVCELRAQGNP